MKIVVFEENKKGSVDVLTVIPRHNYGEILMRGLGYILLIVAVNAAVAGNEPQKEERGDAVRGKYLVDNVALCGRCHTPKDENGDLVHSQDMQGSAQPFLSPHPRVRWATTTPSIAGLPQYSTEEAVKLLMTGISRTGKKLMGPMPQFRMNEKDARDVVRYLKLMP